METDEIIKTGCQTTRIGEDGETIIQDKVKFETLDDAIVECKKQNLMPEKTHKLVPYKCKVCYKYHIGRNGFLITEKYRDKLRKEKKEAKKQAFDDNLRNAEFTVVGTVDLSKFDTTVKMRKNGTKKIIYK